MHLTLVFEGLPDGPPPIYSLVYHSAPVWVQGVEEIVICDYADSNPGWFDSLLKSISLPDAVLEKKEATIIAHEKGHGEPEHLDELVREMRGFGFRVTVLMK